MTLSPGTRLGPYQVIEPLGAGGMGEVYRARDERLGRDVAVKILREAHALDDGRRSRFEREARVLSALNHPNIASLIGVEQMDSGQALVMEFAEGLTLADHVAINGHRGGGLPLADALAIALQVARGLEAAHENGIVHRDLKPSNIAVRADGTVKILDFGLAKPLEPAAGSDAAVAVTLTDLPNGTTGPGTPAYMSPEQARGLRTDTRSDIWAFGCVLYELLTGRRAFDGDRPSDVMAKILEREPDFAPLPPDTPPSIRHLVRRCLQKDPQQRLRDIGDARLELQEALSPPAEALTRARPSTAWRWLAMACLALAAIVGVATWLPRTTGAANPAVVTRFSFPAELSIGSNARNVVISPDGTRIVFATKTGFIVRMRDRLEQTPLPEVAGLPFISPDGQWIGYINEQTMRRVHVSGGRSSTLAEIGPGATASWGRDGIIVSDLTGLYRVPEAGGAPQRLPMPELGTNEQALYPEFLPGGRAVLLTVVPTRTIAIGQAANVPDARIELVDLDSGTRQVLLRGGSRARYFSTGHLVYASSGSVMAVPFDLAARELRGEPTAMVSGVARDEFAISDEGTLVYLSGGESRLRTLVWVDRQGRQEDVGAPARAYAYPRLSPDGRRIALDVQGPPDREIYIWDLGRRTLERFTVDPAANPLPNWSPDGQSLVFGSDRSGATAPYIQPADRREPPRRLLDGDRIQMPIGFTPDGQLLISQSVSGQGRDIYILKMDGRREAAPLVESPGIDGSAEVSPDGRWLAYDSNESGQFEVYVRPFPNAASARWQISIGGGRQPMWSRDGRELFYRDFAAGLWSVPITSPDFSAGLPVKILDGAGYAGGGSALGARTYDLSRDGKRLLMLKPVPTEAPGSLVVVLNWFEELKERAR